MRIWYVILDILIMLYFDHLKWNLPELIEALLDLRQHINHLHHPNLADFDYLAPLLNLFLGHIRSFGVRKRFTQWSSLPKLCKRCPVYRTVHFWQSTRSNKVIWKKSESDRTYGSTWFWLVDIKSSQIMNFIQFWNDQNSINSRSVSSTVFEWLISPKPSWLISHES